MVSFLSLSRCGSIGSFAHIYTGMVTNLEILHAEGLSAVSTTGFLDHLTQKGKSSPLLHNLGLTAAIYKQELLS
jgi:hypothetical protein